MPAVVSPIDHVAALASCHLLVANDASAAAASDDLQAFVTDPNVSVLFAFRDGAALRFSRTLDAADKRDTGLILAKTRPEALSTDSLPHGLIVSSFSGSASNSLYTALRQVYAPLVMADTTLGERVQKLVTQLEAGLGTTLRAKSGKAVDQGAGDNLDGILTLSDEIMYWKEIGQAPAAKAARAVAKEYASIEQRYAGLIDMSASAIVELLDEMQDTLDNIWQLPDAPYNQARMRRVFSVIASDLVRCLHQLINKLQVWDGEFSRVHDGLRQAQDVCEKWTQVTRDLTGRFWRGNWSGEAYADQAVVALDLRLGDIMQIRATHRQLTRLLGKDVPGGSDVFEPFRRVPCLQVSEYAQPMWKRAVASYEADMGPIEGQIAALLRDKLNKASSSPMQALAEFSRYRTLLKRRNVQAALAAERQVLASQLTSMVHQLRDEFEARAFAGDTGATDTGRSGVPGGRNMPLVVQCIVWARQLTQRLAHVTTACRDFLQDAEGITTLLTSAETLDGEINVYRQEQFATWRDDIVASLRDSSTSLHLEMTGRLMELDSRKGGELRVAYSDRLVSLLREVRQLSTMGFTIPKEIVRAADTAQRFYRHGVVLKQVANFYNTIDSQMVPSQAGMLMKAAVAFEEVIKYPRGRSNAAISDKAITWDNPAECEAYIAKLQAAAERLTSENRKLRRVHEHFAEKVVALMNTDLLRNAERWKSTRAEMRKKIDELEAAGFKDTLAWKIHWDHQMYKALEHAYQLGLVSLNETLPEIRAELVFKAGRLQFRPSLEEIRAKYYREMKKFVMIPAKFAERSLSRRDIFSALIERSASQVNLVYTKAERLFQRLLQVAETFRDWVGLGGVNLDDFAEQHLHDVSDWEANFKMLKNRGKAAAKLPNEVRVDCILLSCAPVRATIDDHMQQLADALVTSLRAAASKHSNIIETFIKTSLEQLEAQPESVEEIGAQTRAFRQLSEDKDDKHAEIARFEEKSKLLRAIVGSQALLDSAQLRSKWDTFEQVLAGNEARLKKHSQVLRSRTEQALSRFGDDLAKFAARWQELKPGPDAIKSLSSGSTSALAIVQTVKEQSKALDDLKAVATSLRAEAEHFASAGAPEDAELVTMAKFPQLDEIQADVEAVGASWSVYEEYSSGLAEMAKQPWLTFRATLYTLDDWLVTWQGRLKADDISEVGVHILQQVHALRAAVPSLKYLRGDAFTQEHWQVAYQQLGISSAMSLTGEGDRCLTLQHLLDVVDAINAYADDLRALQSRAQGESSIREAMAELLKWGTVTLFSLFEHTDVTQRSVMLIKDWKDLMTGIGDNQALLQSLKDSPYYVHFAEEASVWETKLSALDSHLHALNAIQRKWLYLEPIFGRGALPAQQKRFRALDNDFINLMGGIARDNRLVALASVPGIADTLRVLQEQLDFCQRALAEFLEEKRGRFPRFYFIGDEDLLEILGQAKDPNVIQMHLKKLFAGIHRVIFADECGSAITAMCSSAGEVVKLRQSVTVTENVEDWLSDLASEMIATLQALLIDALKDGADADRFPSQILCLAEQIQFTARVEAAIAGNDLEGVLAQTKQQLVDLTGIDTGDDQVLDLKIKSLVLDVIHMVDVVEQLIDARVTDLSAWQWQKQLRTYMDSQSGTRAVLRMVDAEFAYTYEYQGNAAKLVHTPLTDKCYLTLTQGMHLGYGGNPYGPAGTGKTESVKALGNSMGRQVLVFNCDEAVDFRSMGRIFTGLVKCGAWGCFDEFNRLDEEVLSAVSQQIQLIQSALKEQAEEMTLLGRRINVDSNSGIFVTMNPAGKGYGGRSKLPDNLKQLFRSVAMSAPDNEQIAETILFSEGFAHAKSIARKLVACFKLCRELLSAQQHYDWGLRALKTILRVAGSLVHRRMRESEERLSEEQETLLLIQAMRGDTLSKLTYADAQRFHGIVSDVFPGVSPSDIEYAELEHAIHEVLKEHGLQALKHQVRKMLQLYEASRQRMGVVIVGPSGSGKSTLWRVLRQAMERTGHAMRVHTMNPKAMPRHRLLGHMDMDTREWFDGVLTASARQVVGNTEQHHWIVCDGDIDPEWIEALNSVLDDNRLLTMPSGERIKFAGNVNFLFECENLTHASPATVSRMGVIYLSDEDLDDAAIVASALDRVTEPALRDQLACWIDELFYTALTWVRKQRDRLLVQVSDAGLVRGALAQLVQCGGTRTQFVLALIQGLGSNLAVETRIDFAKEVFAWARVAPPDLRRPLDCWYDSASGSLLAYATDTSGAEAAESAAVQPVVDTIDVQRAMHTLQPWLEAGAPFLVVGPEGCGKSMILRKLFAACSGTSVATVHCSAQTSSQHVIQKLKESCRAESTNVGRVYRPKTARLVLFLKDLNLPRPDKYGTSELIAFLHQLVTYSGFYDDNLEWIGVERVVIVGSMAPSSTLGRHRLDSRFTSVCRVAVLTYPDRVQLEAVLTTMARYVLPAKDQTLCGQMAAAMSQVYAKLRKRFSVDDHAHYQFTPRDLTEWIMALRRYDLAAEPAVQVWAYEAARVLRDRLVGVEATSWFDSTIAAAVRDGFGTGSDVQSGAGFVYTAVATGNASGSGGSGSGDEGDGKLQRLGLDEYTALAERSIKLYERETRELNIVLFPAILHRLARIERVLTRRGGALLLVGRSGVGRSTLVELVCHMQGIAMFRPMVSRGYGRKQFGNDLKAAMQQAGVQGEQAVLSLDDHMLVEPEFIEMINSLLSAGEVPGLYTPEELEAVLLPLREQQSSAGWRGTTFDFFVSRVRANLHVVLTMDPTHSDFQRRCQSNPALFTVCTVMWLGAWSKEEMRAVPPPVLRDVADECPADLVARMVQLHESCVGRGATPRHFVAFLHTFRQVFQATREERTGRLSHLQKGLGKLSEAAAVVEELKRSAGETKIDLARKQEEADAALDQITRSVEDASVQKSEMEVLQASLAKEESEIAAQKSEVEQNLSGVAPLVEEAKRAVGSIQQSHLNDIRNLRLPPETIRDIVEGVLRVLGQNDTSWVAMKAFLGKRGVKEEIIHFDAHLITPEIRERVGELLETRARSFDPRNAMRASHAAAPLASWVKAQVRYSEVLESIAPMEGKLASLTAKLESSKKRVSKLLKGISKLDNRVAELKAEFGAKTSEAERLKTRLADAEAMIAKAEALVGKLGDEKQRWEQTVGEISDSVGVLPWHAMLAAGFVVYLPDASETERQQMMQQWHTVLGIDEFDVARFMSSESEQLGWKAEGLPADTQSVQNGIILLQSTVTPLLIDPSMHATRWLQEHLAEAKVEQIAMQDPRFANTLELAVRFGKTLIVTEADAIEPMLYPLLRRELVRQGPRWVVAIGDKLVDYSPTFRLFLVTRSLQPDVPPDAAPLLAVTNFSVTRSGLEGQLLSRALQHEMPELETKKSESLRAEEQCKMQLAELEKRLLEALANSTGSLLDNTELIESLNETKTRAAAISVSLADSKELQASLNEQREVYRPVAAAGAVLFFLVRDLQRVNHMYQFSLRTFLRLFQQALEVDQAGETRGADVAGHVAALTAQLQRLVFAYVSRSLFKDDRVVFALHLVHKLHGERLFEQAEVDVLLGRVAADRQAAGSNVPAWVPQERVAAFALLCRSVSKVAQAVSAEPDAWQGWASAAEPETRWPAALLRRLSPVQRLLCVQAVRPDRLYTAMQAFVSEQLGVRSITAVDAKLERVAAQESSATTPLLLLATPGMDPASEVRELASRLRGDGQYHELAMGQGQAEAAMALLTEGARAGHWVCLKNLHLVISWLPVLEKELSRLQPHPEFRIWLTSEAHDKFPSLLLQSALTVTFEAPPGLKQNLLRSLEQWTPQWLAQGSALRAQTQFALAWFHAIVQERRTYLPQGWVKFYEFSTSDLRAGGDVIDAVLARAGGEHAGPEAWRTIRGLLQNAIYGGRVDNEFDMRVLTTYLSAVFSTDVLGSVSGRPLYPRAPPLPVSCNKAEYTAWVSALPDADMPELFGLPPTITASMQRGKSTAVVAQLGALDLPTSTAAGFDRDRWQAALSPLLQAWEAMLETSPVLTWQAPAATAATDAVAAFALLEAVNAHALVRRVNTVLSSVAAVLRGTALLTADVAAAAQHLLRGDLPPAWDHAWDTGPSGLHAWLAELVRRTAAVERWLSAALGGTLLKPDAPLALGDLFRPTTFLNALRQQTARVGNLPMDSLKLVAAWRASDIGSAALPVCVTGLWLQGAGFAARLLDHDSSGTALTALPAATLAWLPASAADPARVGGDASVALPVYSTLTRDCLVTQLRLACSGAETTWILSGAAVFISNLD